MDALSAIFFITFTSSLFAALGLAASIWGVDSRPTIGDDHAR
jgi:hypothetical protein